MSDNKKQERFYNPKKSAGALLVKYSILGLASALLIFGSFFMFQAGLVIPAVITAIAVLGINWLYLTERLIPLKYLLPGLITMLIFGVLPIIYSVYIAFTNYSTGHYLDKAAAIAEVKDAYTDFDSFTMQMATDSNGELVYLLQRYSPDYEDLGSFVGTKDELVKADKPFKLNMSTYAPKPPAGYTALSKAEASKAIRSGDAFEIDLGAGRSYVVDSTSSGFERARQWTYDAKTDSFVDNSCGNVFKNNNAGTWAGKDCKSGKYREITTGYMTVVGAKNFLDIFQNPRYSEAMPRVFVWTIVYAFSSVFLTFSVGVLVALLFNTPVMRGRKLYRSLLIIPYAIPGFLSILIWKGLLNDQWGTINTLLGLDVHWLTDPNIAKISILLVNTWLGFPYMFLVATGALQAIPAELKEAASVDGANRFQSFRNVTLPLLMVAVGPLLVGSFSFNFNNFNQIYLLTGGGPALQNSKSAAGATDILISYTYKLAFASGKGNNYGLSAAVSILIFFIVGALSFWSFRRSKALENMA
jgi:arabinogalactan oligomer/maltooligosaccharide transport system permease protein